MISSLQVVRIGEVARSALERNGGLGVPLAGFVDAPYLEADKEIIWVGTSLPAFHPRAVLVSSTPQRGVSIRFERLPARGWSPRRLILDSLKASGLKGATAALCAALLRGAAPLGFGALLARQAPGFPLDLAMPLVRALEEAYRRDDPDAILAASIALLGIGAGLTPSGDDLAGGALFGRRFVAPRDQAFHEIARRLSAEVAVRSSPISAALFRDLAEGRSFSPLHDLVAALAQGEHGAALLAGRGLVRIGGSSGWDMLAGLMIGLTGGGLRTDPEPQLASIQIHR